MNWVRGTITDTTRKDLRRGLIKGDNNKTYILRENSFAPDDRAHAVRVGDRVRFEDRLGYVFDLHVIDGGQA